MFEHPTLRLILIAFITGKSNLQPLLEGLAQIYMMLSSQGFGRNRTKGPVDNPYFR